jgi:hypothetical protein
MCCVSACPSGGGEVAFFCVLHTNPGAPVRGLQGVPGDVHAIRRFPPFDRNLERHISWDSNRSTPFGFMPVCQLNLGAIRASSAQRQAARVEIGPSPPPDLPLNLLEQSNGADRNPTV